MSKYTYRYEGDRVYFKFPYSPSLVKEIKEFAGAYWGGNDFKAWVVPIIDGTEEKIIDFMEKYDFKHLDDAMRVAEQKLTFEPVDYAFIEGKISMLDLPYQPRDYQLQTIAYGLEYRQFINALPMGTGKTYTSILTTELAKAYPCLVITPASVKYQFAMEWQKILGKTAAVIETKETKKHKNNWGADIVVINYDILGKMVENGKFDASGKAKKSLQLRFNELTDIKWKSCIIDEFHFIKNPKAARSKAVLKVVKPIELKQGLTGTPVNSKPKDLVPLLKTLGKFEAVCPGGWTSFVRTYCGAKYEFGRLNTDGASNLIQLNQKMRDNCYIRFEKEDILKELPAVTRTIIDTPLSSMTKYNKAESDIRQYMLDRDGVESAEKVDLGEVLVLINTLMQLVIEAKMKFINQYIKDFMESGERLVVFGVHRQPLIDLQAKFGGGLIIGGTTAKKKKELVDNFNTENERILFVNIKAGGTGVDHLQDNCSNAIFIEPPWTPAELEQAIARLDRIGQKSPVNINLLFAMETIDGKVWNDILMPKSEVANATNKGVDVELDELSYKKLFKYFVAK